MSVNDVDLSLCELDASEMVDGFESGELSPVEVTDSALGRMTDAEPHIHAMYLIYHERARAAAAASAQRWRDRKPLSPIDGVPVTVKENVNLEGEPTPWGSAASLPTPASSTAPLLERLTARGAVVLGKTTMPEWGMLSSGVSTLHPTTCNPWNLSWNPGGSSAGAGAAAAAGYAPIHFGSDIGGSVRLPASWCGIAGFKPSFGRIPVDPPYFGRTIGPMGREVEDLARVMGVVSGPDDRDPYSLPPQKISWGDLEFKTQGLRVGLHLDAGAGTETSPEIAAAVSDAAQFFESQGSAVEIVDPFFSDEMLERVDMFWRAGHWLDYEALPVDRRGLLLEFIAEWCRAGSEVSGLDAVRSSNAQLEVAIQTLRATQPYDLVLSPVSPDATYPVDWPMPSNDVTRPMAHIGFCMPYNMSGQPAASVHCGFTSDGRPIGLQIVGPRFADREVLAAATHFQRSHPIDRPWPRPWERP
ncbi:amidase [Gordonia jinhuaensis]|uniref:Amidase n=1 Tax=Gordonia jinhuaensis TaxID=1517702 RepID=A0A916TB32_9ACTN|nr:amidase [Gordonia jinhuaensis]